MTTKLNHQIHFSECVSGLSVWRCTLRNRPQFTSQQALSRSLRLYVSSIWHSHSAALQDKILGLCCLLERLSFLPCDPGHKQPLLSLSGQCVPSSSCCSLTLCWHSLYESMLYLKPHCVIKMHQVHLYCNNQWHTFKINTWNSLNNITIVMGEDDMKHGCCFGKSMLFLFVATPQCWKNHIQTFCKVLFSHK